MNPLGVYPTGKAPKPELKRTLKNAKHAQSVVHAAKVQMEERFWRNVAREKTNVDGKRLVDTRRRQLMKQSLDIARKAPLELELQIAAHVHRMKQGASSGQHPSDDDTDALWYNAQTDVLELESLKRDVDLLRKLFCSHAESHADVHRAIDEYQVQQSTSQSIRDCRVFGVSVVDGAFAAGVACFAAYIVLPWVANYGLFQLPGLLNVAPNLAGLSLAGATNAGASIAQNAVSAFFFVLDRSNKGGKRALFGGSVEVVGIVTSSVVSQSVIGLLLNASPALSTVPFATLGVRIIGVISGQLVSTGTTALAEFSINGMFHYNLHDERLKDHEIESLAREHERLEFITRSMENHRTSYDDAVAQWETHNAPFLGAKRADLLSCAQALTLLAAGSILATHIDGSDSKRGSNELARAGVHAYIAHTIIPIAKRLAAEPIKKAAAFATDLFFKHVVTTVMQSVPAQTVASSIPGLHVPDVSSLDQAKRLCIGSFLSKSAYRRWSRRFLVRYIVGVSFYEMTTALNTATVDGAVGIAFVDWQLRPLVALDKLASFVNNLEPVRVNPTEANRLKPEEIAPWVTSHYNQMKSGTQYSLADVMLLLQHTTNVQQFLSIMANQVAPFDVYVQQIRASLSFGMRMLQAATPDGYRRLQAEWTIRQHLGTANSESRTLDALFAQINSDRARLTGLQDQANLLMHLSDSSPNWNSNHLNDDERTHLGMSGGKIAAIKAASNTLDQAAAAWRQVVGDVSDRDYFDSHPEDVRHKSEVVTSAVNHLHDAFRALSSALGAFTADDAAFIDGKTRERAQQRHVQVRSAVDVMSKFGRSALTIDKTVDEMTGKIRSLGNIDDGDLRTRRDHYMSQVDTLTEYRARAGELHREMMSLIDALIDTTDPSKLDALQANAQKLDQLITRLDLLNVHISETVGPDVLRAYNRERQKELGVEQVEVQRLVAEMRAMEGQATVINRVLDAVGHNPDERITPVLDQLQTQATGIADSLERGTPVQSELDALTRDVNQQKDVLDGIERRVERLLTEDSDKAACAFRKTLQEQKFGMSYLSEHVRSFEHSGARKTLSEALEKLDRAIDSMGNNAVGTLEDRLYAYLDALNQAHSAVNAFTAEVERMTRTAAAKLETLPLHDHLRDPFLPPVLDEQCGVGGGATADATTSQLSGLPLTNGGLQKLGDIVGVKCDGVACDEARSRLLREIKRHTALDPKFRLLGCIFDRDRDAWRHATLFSTLVDADVLVWEMLTLVGWVEDTPASRSAFLDEGANQIHIDAFKKKASHYHMADVLTALLNDDDTTTADLSNLIVQLGAERSSTTDTALTLLSALSPATQSSGMNGDRLSTIVVGDASIKELLSSMSIPLRDRAQSDGDLGAVLSVLVLGVVWGAPLIKPIGLASGIPIAASSAMTALSGWLGVKMQEHLSAMHIDVSDDSAKIMGTTATWMAIKQVRSAGSWVTSCL